MHFLDTVGNTPLLTLDRISKDIPGVKILAKAEFRNPSGSVKDRAARAMILDGIEKGFLSKVKTLVDATSGNTGIAYAMMGAALGFKVALFLPSNASRERKDIIRAYGAEIRETDPLEGSDGAFLAARKAAEEHPELYYYPDQYNNPVNPQAHYETTGVEIWEQTQGLVSHFICSMGTSGTFTGSSKRLKQYNQNIKTICVQPDSPLHGIEGTKHMASTIKPGIYDASVADDTVIVSTDEAYHMTCRLAREEGLLVGISSGANVAAALKLASGLKEGSTVVTILGDTGARYLSDSFWQLPL